MYYFVVVVLLLLLSVMSTVNVIILIRHSSCVCSGQSSYFSVLIGFRIQLCY